MMSLGKPDPASLVLVEEYAHRAINEYTLAIATLHLAARDLEDAFARRHLSAAADRLHALATAHRALAMPAPEDCRDITEYITRVCATLTNALVAQTTLKLDVRGSEAVIGTERSWRLALIISELVHNASRHGAHGGKILVELASTDTELICRVSNEGSSPEAQVEGRGRRIVTALAQEMGGAATWTFAPSAACARVIVPLEAALHAEADAHLWRADDAGW